MAELKHAVERFLSARRIGVAGVSRDGAHVANIVFRRMRDAGYDVVPLNPHASELESAAAYASPAAVPGGVDAVFAATHPDAAADVVRQCLDAGVQHVWLHRSFGGGSVAPAAVELAERNGLDLIAGACPMMYIEPVDPVHRCMRWLLGVTGRLPTPCDAVAAAGVRATLDGPEAGGTRGTHDCRTGMDLNPEPGQR